MKLQRVSIKNFRAHCDTSISLNQFDALIGANNAGKSSVLHAIQFALEDRRIDEVDFRKLEKPVEVELAFSDIAPEDVARVSESHRDKVSTMISNGELVIRRIQSLDDKPTLEYRTLRPIAPDLQVELFKEKLKGKKGSDLRAAAVEAVPELRERLPNSPSQAVALECLSDYIQTLPEEAFEPCFRPYPTGISAAVRQLFPQVIYIESVKDVSTEIKATGTATFARLINLLFGRIEDQFSDVNSALKRAHTQLSRTTDHRGNEVDERLPAVAAIESQLEANVAASFPGISLSLDVPPPTLVSILSNAQLLIDDGHQSPVTVKGDGLKRTVIFALLRTYAEQEVTETPKQPGTPFPRPNLLLFEEPELYLHPRSQRQLMTAIAKFAESNQALVTTHSPAFFGPNTQGFTKLSRDQSTIVAHTVDLTSINKRDSYQLVRYENNEAAIFADAVVLVEGDSDTFTLPHIAKLLNDKWDVDNYNISFVTIEGKTNVRRYVEFFRTFNIKPFCIVDLDAVIEGFDSLSPSDEAKELRSLLLGKLDSEAANFTLPEPPSKKVRSIFGRDNAREMLSGLKVDLKDWRSKPAPALAERIELTLAALVEVGSASSKLSLLKEPPTGEIKQNLDNLLEQLREEGIFILHRGDLEWYCGTSANSDKISAAQQFCRETTTLESFRELHGESADEVVEELRSIFSRIFESL